MRCISLARPSYSALMGAGRKGANKTDITVAYYRGSPNGRSTLQVTIHPGKTQDANEHIAFQRFLWALHELQKASARRNGGG